MGPIERELRTAPVENEAIYQWMWTCISARSRLVLQGSCAALCSIGSNEARLQGRLPEAVSDAVEFAASEGI